MAQAMLNWTPRSTRFNNAPKLKRWYEDVWSEYMLADLPLDIRHFELYVRLEYDEIGKCYWCRPAAGIDWYQDKFYGQVFERVKDWNRFTTSRPDLKRDDWMIWLAEFKRIMNDVDVE